MADDQNQENQDSSDDSQDTGQNQNENLENENQEGSDVDSQKFSKAQMQQMGSMLGSIVQKQVKEAIDNEVKPMFQSRPDNTDVTRSSHPAYNQLNEQWQERILAGDVLGVLKDWESIRKNAQRNLTESQKKALTSEATKYAERPEYKDIYPNMIEMASKLVDEEGYPPAAAMRTAYAESHAAHLSGKGKGDEGLELASQGRRAPSKAPGKLPAQFEAAYQRDKAQGLFKDRKEFIESLAPQIRAQYEL